MILITGVAGFIGMSLTQKLLKEQNVVVGIDNLNDYYSVALKEKRLAQLKNYKNFTFLKLDLKDLQALKNLFAKYSFSQVVHLAAQAGVGYSLKNPRSYLENNTLATFNLLEEVKKSKVKHFLYASSSSVYGEQKKVPFGEEMKTDAPQSFYAATKKQCEIMVENYAHLYGFSALGLRFFTVYGPWGRPDMSPYLFAHALKNHEKITLYNQGVMTRDFTYIDDITTAISKLLLTSTKGHQVLNIGRGSPVKICDFLNLLSEKMNKPLLIRHKELPPGDVFQTYSNTKKLYNLTGFSPQISLAQGLDFFLEWFRGLE